MTSELVTSKYLYKRIILFENRSITDVMLYDSYDGAIFHTRKTIRVERTNAHKFIMPLLKLTRSKLGSNLSA